MSRSLSYRGPVHACSQEFDSLTSRLSGMAPLIRAILSKYIGEEPAQAIEIISNDVDLTGDETHKWEN